MEWRRKQKLFINEDRYVDDDGYDRWLAEKKRNTEIFSHSYDNDYVISLSDSESDSESKSQNGSSQKRSSSKSLKKKDKGRRNINAIAADSVKVQQLRASRTRQQEEINKRASHQQR